jgi:adenylosuccinate synthase
MIEIVLDDWAPYSTNFAHAIKDDEEYFKEIASSNRTVVLESTQGTLLDRRVGFPPYVTNSDVAISAGRELLENYLPGCESKAIGVVRSYAVRHGDGPLPTRISDLPEGFVDTFNKPNPWQGPLLFGWLDMVLLKYATIAGGKPDVLALTCIDQLQDLEEIPVCTSYCVWAKNVDKQSLEAFNWHESYFGSIRINAIGDGKNIPEQSARENAAKILFEAKPDTWEKLKDSESLHAYLESELQAPIGILSMGRKNSEKAQLGNYL